MNEKEVINSMILARLSYYNLAGMLHLYREAGSATAVVENSKHIRDIIPDATGRLTEILSDCDKMRPVAEAELAFNQAHSIKTLVMADDAYPYRLRECADAPLVLYYLGSADLNRSRVINIVGTRHSTIYAQELIQHFVSELGRFSPDVLVVSGLAYGVDICAHRQALDCGLETVGVLAHGLDDLYPSRHKPTARKMVTQGGLLTEFMTHTNADKINFVRRNRIVAGISDACVLVESAAHGGGLITAEIARGYGRDVFAFPGRIGDMYSEGCNNLIRDNGAALLTDAASFVKAMGWESDAELSKARTVGIARDMFPDLSAEEQAVVNVLKTNNDLNLNILAVQAGMSVIRLTAVLFELEMKGVVRSLAGGTYHLLS